MRATQLVAVALMVVGAAAAVLTIWQIVDARARESELSGSAPVLVGDAPPPVTSTHESISASDAETTSGAGEIADASTSSAARNLAPAAQPSQASSPNPTIPEATTAPIEGAALGASRPPAQPGASPSYLRIPRIGIEPAIVPVGFNEWGEMASPSDFFQVGWWQHGAVPGDYGRAVLAGHVDTPDGEAIFYGIDRLEPGDEIFVGSAGGDGTELRFVVTGAALYHIDHAPVDQIFGPSTDRELILITCGGAFDHDSGQYLYRRVVFAELAP